MIAIIIIIIAIAIIITMILLLIATIKTGMSVGEGPGSVTLPDRPADMAAESGCADPVIKLISLVL